jgi:hypothetical protein
LLTRELNPAISYVTIEKSKCQALFIMKIIPCAGLPVKDAFNQLCAGSIDNLNMSDALLLVLRNNPGRRLTASQ